MCRILCGPKFLVQLGKYLRVWLHYVCKKKKIMKLITCLQRGCAILYSISNEWEFCYYISWPVFGIVSVLDFSHDSVVVSYCFNLKIPNDIWCWIPFQMLICHLYIPFSEIILIICPLFNYYYFFKCWS